MEHEQQDNTTITEKLSRGQEVSFPIEEVPAKIELSLDGVRDEHSGKAGIEPSSCLCLASIYVFPLIRMEL